MVTTIDSERKLRDSSGTISEQSLVEIRELVAFCPKCKTLETLWFTNDYLMQTRKFGQRREEVYHDCGAKEPCRLYRSF
jgi:phage FluMu protein Com